MDKIKLELPSDKETLARLNAGDFVLLSGIVYTARDAAHKRIIALIEENKPLPFPLENSAVYYTGPAGTKPGEIIGVCGPTSSSRMDSLTPPLLERGLNVMIGKGRRSPEVIAAMKENTAVYLLAVGGAAAYYRRFISSCEIIAFPDLGPEAVRRLTVTDFPALVGIDSRGNSILK